MTSSKSVLDTTSAAVIIPTKKAKTAKARMTAISQPSSDESATLEDSSSVAAILAAIMECKETLKGQMDLIASDVSWNART